MLQAERGTPAGLALWLTWQLGLQAQEIISLTWDQVDFSKDALRFEDRELPLTNAVRRILEDTRRKRRSGDPPQVLLTERSRKPLDLPRAVPHDPGRPDPGRYGAHAAAGPAAG